MKTKASHTLCIRLGCSFHRAKLAKVSEVGSSKGLVGYVGDVNEDSMVI